MGAVENYFREKRGGLVFRSIARTIQLDDVVLLDDVLIGPHNCVRSRKYPAWRIEGSSGTNYFWYEPQ